MRDTAGAAPPHDPSGDSEHGTMLRSMFEAPHIRERLHTICSLYYYSRDPRVRRGLLGRLEDLTLEVAHLLAVDLLENGWRPDEAVPVTSAEPELRRSA
jgi:hypothetical protein